MFVFVSHAHHDHYRKDIFNLRKHFREIRYVLSSDIEIKAEKKISFRCSQMRRRK